MNGYNVSQKRYSILFMLMIGIVMGIVCSKPAQAQNDLCVSDIGIPIIDGNLDAGWRDAPWVNLRANPGVIGFAEFKIGKTNNDVYMSFAAGMPSIKKNYTIVLGLQTDRNPAHDWRIQIQLFKDLAIDCENEVPYAVTFWRNSNTWNNGAQGITQLPDWLKDNIKFTKNKRYWVIEIQIPREYNIDKAVSNDKIYFPKGTGDGDTFKLYANLVITSNVDGKYYYTQAPWPTDTLITPLNGNLLIRNTPKTDSWGTLSLFPRRICGGISLEWNNIGVKDPFFPSVITSNIMRYKPIPSDVFPEANTTQCDALPYDYLWPGTKGPLNIFVAKPYNGASEEKSVRAEFKIANWGIPGETDWGLIGKVANDLPPLPTVTSNPTLEASIPSGSYGDLTSTWNLSYKQSCLYSYNSHQCIQVHLSSTDTSTVFLNNDVQKNMDFVTNPMFTRVAEISAKGYGAPPEGRSKHGFLITVDTEVVRAGKQYSDLVEKQAGAPAFHDLPTDKRYETMNWIARGYIKTGQYLIIDDRKYEYVKAVGGFGYIAQHVGDLKNWRSSFQGAALKSFKDGNYTIEIPPEEIAKVTTTIKAVDFSPFAIIVRGGITIPQGTVSNLLDPGLSLHLGLEYLFSSAFSLEAIFGYHQFKYVSFGNKLKLYQFSLNGRLYFVNTPFRPFINTGAGIYNFNPGDSKFGYNGGGGLQYALSPQFALEAVYNYHIVNAEKDNFKFSTIQGGFRYRF